MRMGNIFFSLALPCVVSYTVSLEFLNFDNGGLMTLRTVYPRCHHHDVGAHIVKAKRHQAIQSYVVAISFRGI